MERRRGGEIREVKEKATVCCAEVGMKLHLPGEVQVASVCFSESKQGRSNSLDGACLGFSSRHPIFSSPSRYL